MFFEVKNLGINIGQRRFNYNFSCEKKECIGIFGPSGYGKTSFFRGVTGLEKAVEGKIYLDGKDITNLPVNKRKIAFMFQDYAVFENLTVEKNLKFVLIANKVKRKLWNGMIDETLSFVGLLDKKKQLSATLSGGEKQRLAIARCIILPPKLLLMDEPFNSLDAIIKESISQNLKKLRNKFDVTIVIISHDMSELTDLIDCDRIINIEDMVEESEARQ